MSTAAASKTMKGHVAALTRQNSQRAAASKCSKKLMELAVVCYTPSPVAREAAQGAPFMLITASCCSEGAMC